MKFNMIRTAQFLAATMLVLSLAATAPAQEKVKTVDLRNSTDADGNHYYIVFMARGESMSGHAFAALGVDDATAKSCRSRTFGFYPVSGKKGVLGPVPGKIVDEGFARSTHRLVVQINKRHFDAAENIRLKWSRKKNFRLLESDCVSFIEEIAAAVGAKTPPRTAAKLPQTFVGKMLNLN